MRNQIVDQDISFENLKLEMFSKAFKGRDFARENAMYPYTIRTSITDRF